MAGIGISKALYLLSGRTYQDVSLADLKYLLEKGAGSFVRGFLWSLLRLRRPRGLLLGRGIKFISAERLRFGRGVSLGHGCYLECSAIGGVSLGDNVTIREYGWLQCRSGLNARGGTVRIGDSVYIGPFAVLGAGGDLIIESGCQIGARLTVSAESHGTDDGSFVSGAVSRRGVTIGRNCWIGNNVCVLDGVRIGERCVIGAGSVVTRNLPDGCIAYGVPARVRQAGAKAAANPCV